MPETLYRTAEADPSNKHNPTKKIIGRNAALKERKKKNG
jgi:hypothetical protein